MNCASVPHVMQRLVFALLILAFPLLTSAKEPSVWWSMSNGHHSLRKLGSQFIVNVPVKPIEGARLVLFNERVARELGLDLPSDPKELEDLILRNFAFVINDHIGVGGREWFATYYQDATSKGPGSPRGDGRALWSGELPVRRGQGMSSIDVVLKGVGQTPLAWTKHPDPSHKDGLQSMREAITSFLLSEANYRNQLNTTVDLAVFEIPLTKTDHNGRVEKAAVSIRLGEQTRIANLRYWSDQNGNFEKLFDYIVHRTLGIPMNQPLKRGEREKYFDELAKNLAHEAARYYDLHAVHGSPTSGNRTSSGATIDLGTFRYLDAHHSNYSYLFNKLTLGGEHDQTDQLRTYIEDVAKYGDEVGVQLDADKALSTFDHEFKTHLTALWLNRLGLDESMRKSLSPSTRNTFYKLIKKIHETTARNIIQIGNKYAAPAVFEPRRVFAQALSVLIVPPNQRQQLAIQALETTRPWSQTGGDREIARVQFEIANEMVQLLLRIKNEIPDFNSKLPEAIARATAINGTHRLDLGKELGQSIAAPILAAIQAGNESYVDISRRAMKAVEIYVDPGLMINSETNLGKKRPSGSICADLFARGA